MNIYHVMRMDTAKVKSLIKDTQDKKSKMRYAFAYGLKIVSTVLFCMIVVLLFTALFGPENSIVGVITVIAVMVFEKADLGIKSSHAAFTLITSFLILAIGPQLASLVSPAAGFIINLFCILTLLVLSCHNIIMSNHSTIVLGYLLLMGYEVTGDAYIKRIAGLLFGGIIVAAVFYHKHYKITYRRTFKDLFKEFNPGTLRTQWQLKMALGISLSLFLAEVLHFSRPIWVGIACMSLLQPFTHDLTFRACRRAPFVIIGSIAFGIVYYFMPDSLIPFIGIFGGLVLGLCSSYKWQSAFNCFGAISIVVPQFGLLNAILLRIINNLFGTLFSIAFDKIFTFLINLINVIKLKVLADAT